MTLDDPFIDGVMLQNFRSLLAFPIWLFNANNYGNTQVKGRVLNPNLPAEFYTTAGVVKPLVKLKFDSTLLTLFVVLEGIVLVVLWGCLVWLFFPWGDARGRVTVATAFPVVDFLFRAEGRVEEEGEGEMLRETGSKGVVERFGGVRIHAGEVTRRAPVGKGGLDT